MVNPHRSALGYRILEPDFWGGNTHSEEEVNGSSALSCLADERWNARKKAWMMKHRITLTVRLIFAWAGGIFLLGLVAATDIASPHGGESHENQSPDSTDATAAVADSSETPLDSVFVVIGEGFEALKPTFQRGCFDCHSTHTRYPWYYKLPLVKGMIDKDTREAKKHLDMTNGFPFRGHGKPADDLLSIKDVIVDGDMPPWQYRLMHWGASPSDSETDSIVAWVDKSLQLLSAHGVYPFGRADLVPGGPEANEPVDHSGHEH